MADSKRVIIVGAGPTGLTMAAELIRRGIGCRIIDKAPKPTDQSRALAVHARTLEAFDNMGIADEAIANGIKCPGANVIADGRLLIRVSFTGIRSRYKFALLIPQSETERILNDRLVALGGGVERSTELVAASPDGRGVDATLRHGDGNQERARFEWMVGCDGAHSVVRHALGIAFEGIEYQSSFSLADVHVDWTNPGDELFIYLTAAGPVAFFPMGAGRYRIVAETSGAESDPPTLEEFQQVADRCAPAGTRLYDPVWLERFRIHRRRVPNYRAGRIFLAGDAAHIHSPAGGQGMNTGIQDAFNLGWKLALVVSGGAPDSLLDSYHAERHAVSAEVLKTSDIMTRVATASSALAVALRDHMLPLLGAVRPVPGMIGQQMSGVTINYSGSPIVYERHQGLIGNIAASFSSGPAAGAHAPDCESLVNGNGKSTRLLAAIRSTAHSLLVFAGEREMKGPDDQLMDVVRQAAGRAGDRARSFIVVRDRDSRLAAAADATIVGDPDLLAHRAYGANEPCFYLIRPDGYIALRGASDQGPELIGYLNRIFT